MARVETCLQLYFQGWKHQRPQQGLRLMGDVCKKCPVPHHPWGLHMTMATLLKRAGATHTLRSLQTRVPHQAGTLPSATVEAGRAALGLSSFPPGFSFVPSTSPALAGWGGRAARASPSIPSTRTYLPGMAMLAEEISKGSVGRTPPWEMSPVNRLREGTERAAWPKNCTLQGSGQSEEIPSLPAAAYTRGPSPDGQSPPGVSPQSEGGCKSSEQQTLDDSRALPSSRRFFSRPDSNVADADRTRGATRQQQVPGEAGTDGPADPTPESWPQCTPVLKGLPSLFLLHF